MKPVELFCSCSVKPENHILFALSLTLDIKQEAKKRMQRFKLNYKENKKNYKAEGKILCDLCASS